MADLLDIEGMRKHLIPQLEEGEPDEDLAEEAWRAERGLQEIRSLFYDTPWEEQVTEMMSMCAMVAKVASGVDR